MEIVTDVEIQVIQERLTELTPFELKSFNQTVDYLYANYPDISKLGKPAIKKMVLAFLERILVERNKNFDIIGVSLFCKVSDSDLEQIRNGSFNLLLFSTIKYLLAQEGDNIHFMFVVSKGFKSIWKGLKGVIVWEDPKTVSWFSQDMKRFNIKTIRK